MGVGVLINIFLNEKHFLFLLIELIPNVTPVTLSLSWLGNTITPSTKIVIISMEDALVSPTDRSR